MTKGLWLRGLNIMLLAGSVAVWVAAVYFGWLESVAALVFSALSGLAAAEAAVDSEEHK